MVDERKYLGKRVRTTSGGIEVTGEVVRVEPLAPGDRDRIVEIRMPAQSGMRMAYRRYAKDVEIVP
jgi:hypothetical protein